MVRLSIILILSILSYHASGQNLPPKQAYPYGVKQIHSGHSLTDPLFYPHWPGQYVTLMTQLRGTWAGNDIGKSTIPGSPMRYRWSNSSGSTDAKNDISKYELQCITEVANLCYEGGNNQAWYQDCIREQKEYLSLFVNNAWNNGNQGKGAATLLYSNWVNINGADGPFREMLDKLGGEWERMQDYANQMRPVSATHVYMIPGHKMMARLYDDVQAGKVPGITQFSQFFSDNIHTNELGAFAIAMLHYACIYNKNPLGLPHKLIVNPPSGTPIPSPELAQYLQKMIWEVVTTYPRTGIKDMTSNIESINSASICLYPNPTSNTIILCDQIENSNDTEIFIYDYLGRKVMTTFGNEIDVQHLPKGLYMLKKGREQQKFIKN